GSAPIDADSIDVTADEPDWRASVHVPAGCRIATTVVFVLSSCRTTNSSFTSEAPDADGVVTERPPGPASVTFGVPSEPCRRRTTPSSLFGSWSFTDDASTLAPVGRTGEYAPMSHASPERTESSPVAHR